MRGQLWVYGGLGGAGTGTRSPISCPRSSKPSWADQVEEEGEDGESLCGPLPRSVPAVDRVSKVPPTLA